MLKREKEKCYIEKVINSDFRNNENSLLEINRGYTVNLKNSSQISDNNGKKNTTKNYFKKILIFSLVYFNKFYDMLLYSFCILFINYINFF